MEHEVSHKRKVATVIVGCTLYVGFILAIIIAVVSR